MHEERTMQFVELIFHVAPDGGTGVYELAIKFVLLVLPIAVEVVRRKRTRSS